MPNTLLVYLLEKNLPSFPFSPALDTSHPPASDAWHVAQTKPSASLEIGMCRVFLLELAPSFIVSHLISSHLIPCECMVLAIVLLRSGVEWVGMYGVARCGM